MLSVDEVLARLEPDFIGIDVDPAIELIVLRHGDCKNGGDESAGLTQIGHRQAAMAAEWVAEQVGEQQASLRVLPWLSCLQTGEAIVSKLSGVEMQDCAWLLVRESVKRLLTELRKSPEDVAVVVGHLELLQALVAVCARDPESDDWGIGEHEYAQPYVFRVPRSKGGAITLVKFPHLHEEGWDARD